MRSSAVTPTRRNPNAVLRYRYRMTLWSVGFDRPGAAAEYVTVPAADLAAKPVSVDHLQAAAVPLGALTAWQALHEHAQLDSGQHVLVRGGRRRVR